MKKGVVIGVLLLLIASIATAAPFFEGSVWDDILTGNAVSEDNGFFSFTGNLLQFFATKTPKPTCLETVQLSRWNDEIATFGDERFLAACSEKTAQTGTLPCACTGALTCQAERCGKIIGVIKPTPNTIGEKPYAKNEFKVIIGNTPDRVQTGKQKQIEGLYVKVNKFDAKKEIVELTVSDVPIKALKILATQKAPTKIAQPTKTVTTSAKKSTLKTTIKQDTTPVYGLVDLPPAEKAIVYTMGYYCQATPKGTECEYTLDLWREQYGCVDLKLVECISESRGGKNCFAMSEICLDLNQNPQKGNPCPKGYSSEKGICVRDASTLSPLIAQPGDQWKCQYIGGTSEGYYLFRTTTDPAITLKAYCRNKCSTETNKCN